MNFIEPLFLVGLLAAGLPVLIHLINRRKAVKQAFPPLKFLIQSQRRVATGIKVRQWLMMAIRILVLTLLVLALAKPFFLSASGLTASERLPTATVFVVDTSLSMQSGNWWQEAQSLANNEMDALRPWDEVALVVAGPETIPQIDRFTTDHGRLRTLIGDLTPGGHRANMREAIQLGADLLAGSQLPNRRIVVITDLAEGGLGTEPALEMPYPVSFLNVRSEQDPVSLAVVKATYEQEASQREAVWRIDATIENFSSTDAQDIETELEIDGEVVAASRINVPAHGSTKHTFRHKIADHDGTPVAAVQIRADDDVLEADNRFVIPIQGDASVETLVVNGEPSSVAYTDEIFFLERALNPKRDSVSAIVPVVTTREGFEAKDLKGFDVIILANVSHVSAGAAERLQKFVEGGGGLLITAGDQIDSQAYNQQLGGLLPKPLRGLKQLATRDDPDAPVKITRFGAMKRQHPVFQVFDLPGGDTLQSAVVFSYLLLEPTAAAESDTLLSFKDAAPALIERRVGKGRVLLFTTGVDLDWTDLPTRTAYLPLVQRTVNYLARRATSEGRTQWSVGDEVVLDVTSLVEERVIVLGPEDTREVVTPMDGLAKFRPRAAGDYVIWADAEDDPENRLAMLDFSVNVNTAESRLVMTDSSAIASSDAELESGDTANNRRVNLWPTFLFLVTVLLLLESVVGTRRSVLARIWRAITRQPEPTFDEL